MIQYNLVWDSVQNAQKNRQKTYSLLNPKPLAKSGEIVYNKANEIGNIYCG